MGARSRNKGARGEREVVGLLGRIWAGVKRGLTQTRAGSDCADVEGTPFWIEVKIGQRPNIHAAIEQAQAATDGRPVLVFTRRDGEKWLATMPAEDWVAERERVKRIEDRARAAELGVTVEQLHALEEASATKLLDAARILGAP